MLTPIKLLVPDLPPAASLLPWLQQLDSLRTYTNFGPMVRTLEETLAAHWPGDTPTPGSTALQVVSLNTGTAALELGMAALELPPGARVLLPAFTFPATATAVLRNGLRPLLADVAAEHWQLTPALARAAAAQHALALVVPVATFGYPLDVAGWDAFVADTGIPVLLDAAAAFGHQAIGQRVHAAFSLHATKPFGIGEGGLFVSRNADLAERVRRLSNYGFNGDQVEDSSGTNAKLSEYAAVLALAQWARWPDLQEARARRWAAYQTLLGSIPQLALQACAPQAGPPAALVIAWPEPVEALCAHLNRQHIETRRWYCPLLHQHPAFAQLAVLGRGPEGRALPVSDRLATHSVGLPWHNFVSAEEMARIHQALGHALAERP